MQHRTSIGLDVHARSISAAALDHETGEVRTARFAYDAPAVAQWASGLPQPTHAVYESGPTGFDLARSLTSLGLECGVGAVSKMLRPAGDRVKTDKRDAVFLARMLAVGNVVEVRVPPAEEEAARDLCRARADASFELSRAKLSVSSYLLRKGIAWGGGTWTRAHRTWLRQIELPTAQERMVLDELLARLAECEARKERITSTLVGLAGEDAYRDRVAALRCLRGINTVSALSLLVEVGDFSRFDRAPALASFLGLVPSESSSGERVSRGGITKTGNSHARRLLVEAAWHHGRPYNPSAPTGASAMSAVPPRVAEVAERANRRLHDRWRHLESHGKQRCVVTAAVARELACWAWAVEAEAR